MKFYTNVFARGDKIYLRGYESGKRVEQILTYKPYMFMPKKDGFYKTLEGKQVDKMQFESISDAKEFMKTYSDVDNMDIYGFNNYPYMFIYDNYPGEIQYDPSKISVVTIDIECAADEGFPDIQKADKEITAIALRKNGKSIVFGCGEFQTDDPDVTYVKCKDEATLLSKYLSVWNNDLMRPDIVTGWNIEFFDIPYLVNRIKNVLGNNEAKKMSPWGILEERSIEFMNKEHHILYEIEEYDEELSYLLKQTSDIYNYTYQAPEVKKYLSTILCKCLFLKKKEIKSKHWLSYVLK